MHLLRQLQVTCALNSAARASMARDMLQQKLSYHRGIIGMEPFRQDSMPRQGLTFSVECSSARLLHVIEPLAAVLVDNDHFLLTCRLILPSREASEGCTVLHASHSTGWLEPPYLADSKQVF